MMSHSEQAEKLMRSVQDGCNVVCHVCGEKMRVARYDYYPPVFSVYDKYRRDDDGIVRRTGAKPPFQVSHPRMIVELVCDGEHLGIEPRVP